MNSLMAPWIGALIMPNLLLYLLLIIESVARAPQHVLFTHDLLVKQVFSDF